MYAYKDMTGQKIGRLMVIEIAEHGGHGKTLTWKCLCDCGKEVYVTGKLLRRSDGTKSCGCLKRDVSTQTGKRNLKHGQSNSKLYNVWSSMKKRCNEKNHKSYYRYGGRGITYCSEWEDFNNFMGWALKNGYKENLTLDRIDNDKGYYPENCRWATPKEQSRNRHTNKFLTYKGNTKTIAEWEEILGTKKGTIASRIRHGWSIEKAIETPVKKRSPSKARSNTRASK